MDTGMTDIALLDARKVKEFYKEALDEIDRCKINVSYPYSEEFEYEVCLRRIDLDKERERDIGRGRGFIINSNKAINKEIKEMDGIFSPRYGQSLSDANPYIDRYRCSCGALRSRINNGVVCGRCKTKVKFVDDDFKYFGWLVLNDDWVIHPNLYKTIEFLCGSQILQNILICNDEKDEDGHSVPIEQRNKKGTFKAANKGKNEPFYGIGMRGFRKHFDEIVWYYYTHATNKPAKEEYYKDIVDNRDIIFTQSIPVFTTLLRPFEVSEKKQFAYEATNSIYNMMSKLVYELNDTSLRYKRNSKSKETLLQKIQECMYDLYAEVDKILSGKKGNIRQLFGGRYSFSSRNVIVQNPKLRIDQVTLPYFCLCELLQPIIINILKKSYNISYTEANAIWYKASISQDDRIVKIIENILKNDNGGKGLPVLINRNPTINYGSILQLHVVGMTFGFTMGVPLQILKPLAADFDGDVLNVFLIINDAFYERAFQVFNPRNSMYIDKNDGQINMDVLHQRDTIVNANTLLRLGRGMYTEEELTLMT